MGPKEVQKIGAAMAAVQNVQRDAVQATLEDFINVVQTQTNIGVGSDEYIRNILTDALGEDKARGMIDRILLGGNAKGLESLKWMDARAVVELIRHVIACVVHPTDAHPLAEVCCDIPLVCVFEHGRHRDFVIPATRTLLF